MDYGNNMGSQFFFSDKESSDELTFKTPQFRAIDERLLCVTVPTSSSPCSFSEGSNIKVFEESLASQFSPIFKNVIIDLFANDTDWEKTVIACNSKDYDPIYL